MYVDPRGRGDSPFISYTPRKENQTKTGILFLFYCRLILSSVPHSHSSDRQTMSIELNQRTVNSLTLRRGGNLKEELKQILAAEAETEKLVGQDHPIARGATL